MTAACPYCGFLFTSQPVSVCPSCQTELAADGAAPETHLVAVEAIRQQLAGRTPTAKERVPDGLAEQSPASPPPANLEQRWRPIARPPVAVLRLIDDEGEGGEEFRLREPRTIIGRTEGQVRIPHDSAISSQHLEVTRVLDDARYRWYVSDSGSTNGTFAGVSHALLQHGQELQLGACRFRFEMPPPLALSPSPAAAASTSAWQRPAPQALMRRAALVAVGPADESRFELAREEVLIGTDAGSDVRLSLDDPFAARQHARMSRDKKGRWTIRPVSTRNGVWVRIKRIEVVSLGHFLIGEQRLTLKVPRYEAAT
jgi:pSer/pThr/pTyr-binding forkhead associated (FHA) protein